jgi:signal transduction histidine kinase
MVCHNVELEARLSTICSTDGSRAENFNALRKSDAHDLLEHAMDIVRNDLTSRQLNLSVQLYADDHYVLADSSRLQQVFWNVLKNASKFTPTRGAITVRTFNSKPKTLKIEISDTGVGIEPEQLEKVFDAFAQVCTQREGLGLGLAITKAIVEMHIRGPFAPSARGRKAQNS